MEREYVDYYRFREPFAGPATASAPAPVPNHTIERVGDMLIERDLQVMLADGTPIFVDVFRPANSDVTVPPLVAWSPYGKHPAVKYGLYPFCGVSVDDADPYEAYEGPRPSYWVPRGYAVVHVDPRGTWNSAGTATYMSPEEAQDFYEVIEWAGTQPWSNGKVGLTGVSYLAVAQWRVAALQPPHLAAINPWEGWTDTYRELVRHGGIPETAFWPFAHTFWGTGARLIEDLGAETAEHPLYDEFWESKSADLEKITVPAFVVTSWTDQGMHLRGTIDGFRRISSKEKWLDVHGRMKWDYYYLPENMARLSEFFDHFLKGQDTAIDSWPPVRVEVREEHFVGHIRSGLRWPLEETTYRKLYLDASSERLIVESPEVEAAVTYDSLGGGPRRHRAVFEYEFAEPTDVVGAMEAQLHVSAASGNDMDVFLAVVKLDRSGNVVPFPYYQIHHDGPVALGWIRASHRELDSALSTEGRPVLTHRAEQPVQAGEVIQLNVEIWPSATHFATGERLMLIVQGTDVYKYPSHLLQNRHEDSVNEGRHSIHTGGVHASHLLIPTIPIDTRGPSSINPESSELQENS